MGRPAVDRAPSHAAYKALLAEKLAAVRRHRGISQATIAEVMHIRPNTASSWMNGGSMPSPYDLVLLSNLLDVPAGVLVDPDATVADAVRAVLERDERRTAADLAALGTGASTLRPSPGRTEPAPGDRRPRP